MKIGMARSTKGDQVFFGIVAEMAAELFMVNLKVRHRAAALTMPAITSEHFSAEFLIRLGIKP